MRTCIIDTPDGEDEVRVGSLSFDGGSLILFSDGERRNPVVAYGPYGWLRWRWKEADREVQAES